MITVDPITFSTLKSDYRRLLTRTEKLMTMPEHLSILTIINQIHNMVGIAVTYSTDIRTKEISGFRLKMACADLDAVSAVTSVYNYLCENIDPSLCTVEISFLRMKRMYDTTKENGDRVVRSGYYNGILISFAGVRGRGESGDYSKVLKLATSALIEILSACLSHQVLADIKNTENTLSVLSKYTKGI